jgi:lycopene cyclase CruP
MCEGDWPSNESGDLLVSIQPIMNNTQAFWEAFPAAHPSRTDCRSLRSTYMFSYGDVSPSRRSLADTLDAYVKALPDYQGVNVESLKPIRVLLGFFPAFTDSPLKSTFDRVMHIGDAGSNQSPLSFGGFGSLLRHLRRLESALADALSVRDGDPLLRKRALQAASPVMPTIAVTWLFNRFMSARKDSYDGDYLINKVLALNMSTMEKLGPDVQRPFLQDVVQARGLLKTLLTMTVAEPLLSLQLVPRIGVQPLLSFMYNFLMLAKCSVQVNFARSHPPDESKMDSVEQYFSRRLVEAALYGSGRDHTSQ